MIHDKSFWASFGGADVFFSIGEEAKDPRAWVEGGGALYGIGQTGVFTSVLVTFCCHGCILRYRYGYSGQRYRREEKGG